MLIDCRTVPSSTVLDTDICIVGAGPAGLTLAQALNGANRRIALLERGGEPGPPRGMNGARVSVSSDTSFDAPPRVPPRFGGGANEWIVRLPWMRRGVRMVPLSPVDLERREWIPDSGWPIAWTELERFYALAYERLGLGPWNRRMEEGRRHTCPALPVEEFGFTTAMEHFPPSDVFTRAAWDELRTSSNVTVYLNAPVGSLEGSARSIDHVEIDSLTRARVKIRASVFVLAGGGLENPRLLLDARQGHGVGSAGDVVGRYYMDHLRLISGTIAPANDRILDGLGLYDIRSAAHSPAMGKLIPTPDFMSQHELLHSSAMLLPTLAPEIQEARAAVAAALGSIRSGNVPHDVPSVSSTLKAALLLGVAVPEMTARQRRFPPRVDAGWSGSRFAARRYGSLTVEHQIEQAPDPSNRVVLDSRTDAFGRREIELRWRWTELDLRSIRTTQTLFGQAIKRAGIGTFAPAIWEDEPELTTPGGAFHPMGTTRMHPNPAHGAVDENCRVHGAENVYVAGSSTFPTGGYANPTLTLIALALRLADHLSIER